MGRTIFSRSDEQVARWEAAAELEGMKLAAWIRDALDAASFSVTEPEPVAVLAPVVPARTLGQNAEPTTDASPSPGGLRPRSHMTEGRRFRPDPKPTAAPKKERRR